MKSDARLQRHLVRGLRQAMQGEADRILIDVRSGVVTLAGHVDRYGARERAVACARSVPGVHAVVSEIDVFVRNFSHRPDAEILRSATRILIRTAGLPAGSIGVRVSDGWTTLTGQVEHAHLRDAAVSRVNSVAGVRGTSSAIALA